MNLTQTLLSTFYVAIDKPHATDVLCVVQNEATTEGGVHEAADSFVLQQAALSYITDEMTKHLSCQLTSVAGGHAPPQLLLLELSSDEDKGEEANADSPVDTVTSETKNEVTTPAEVAPAPPLPPAAPTLSSSTPVQLLPPLGAAFIRRSFYYSEYYMPPTTAAGNQPPPPSQQPEKEGKGVGEQSSEEESARRRNCIISNADREALQYMFPVLHHNCVYETVERFEAHCKSDTHLFLCESEPLFPLQLPSDNQKLQQTEEKRRVDAKKTPENTWKTQYDHLVACYSKAHEVDARACEEDQKEWFCALYDPIHTWLQHYFSGNPTVDKLNSFVSFHLSNFLAECIVLKSIQDKGASHVQSFVEKTVAPSDDFPEDLGMNLTETREDVEVKEADASIHEDRNTDEEKDSVFYPDMVCWTSLLSVVPFVVFSVRQWFTVELAALLDAPSSSVLSLTHFYAHYGLTEKEFVDDVANKLSFHIGKHMVSSFRAQYKVERRRACFPPYEEKQQQLQKSSSCVHKDTAVIATPEAENEDEMNVDCCSNAPGRILLASHKRDRTEDQQQVEQGLESARKRQRMCEKEQIQVERMHQLLLLLLAQDRSKLIC